MSLSGGVPFGPFTLNRRLGVGGMAEVFLARRTGVHGFEKELVVKRILPHLCAEKHFVDAFLNEARLAALQNHPNLAQVFDFGQVDGRYYLAMEYVDGVTLRDFTGVIGTLPPGAACRLILDVLDALDAFHRARDLEGRRLHLVHRDVTPRNVMVTRAGTVKLLDFGIAISATSLSRVAGTKRYMAPEQRRGEAIDQRADLYCAALMLVELISGGVELLAPVLGRRRPPPFFPPELWNRVAPALEDSADKRPASARAMLESLEDWALGVGGESSRSELRRLTEGYLPSLTTAGDGVRADAFPEPTLLLKSQQKSARRLAIPMASLVALGVMSLGARFALSDPEPPPPLPVIAIEATAIEAPVLEPPVEPKKKRRAKKKVRRPVAAAPTPIAKEPGWLSIDTKPWTRVFVGDRLLGDTPLEKLSLPAGVHRLRLVNPEVQLSETIEVTIEPERVARVRRTLR